VQLLFGDTGVGTVAGAEDRANLTELLQMEASVKLRLPARAAICETEASLWVTDTLRRRNPRPAGIVGGC